MSPDAPHTYEITGRSVGAGRAEILAKGEPITIDSSPEMTGDYPGPAEMLASAFAACSLKNVERFGRMLPFHQTGAWIRVRATRQDSPPKSEPLDKEIP